MAESARERADCLVFPGQQFQSETLPKMSTLTLILKRFRLVPFLLCFGLSLALNLWPALSQAQTVTLSVDSLFVHYSNLSRITVTAELSAARTGDTTITLSLGGTAVEDTDYTAASLPTITIADGATSNSTTLSLGGPPGITERATKTIIVRGRAPGVSVTSATITLVKDDEAQDRAVLQALYRATNGAGWTANTNWNSPDAALNTWHGVTTDNAGRVTVLHLDNNNLSGLIPPELGHLTGPHLTDLNLSNNNLSGPIPRELGGLTNLEILDLSNNNLSGPIPRELGGLPNLTYLNLSHNDLSVPIPSDLSDLPGLHILNLGGLPNLTYLNLSHNDLSGLIPPDLSGLTRLTDLNLSNNQLTGPIPDLSALDNLEVLDLSHNRLSGDIPDLSALDNLEVLDLSNNQLTGPTPPDLSDLTSLTEIYLNNNQLIGLIPDLSDPTDLRVLDLSHNRLTGPIPDLSGLTNLQVLDLSNNQLRGFIPPDLSDLTDLTSLNLSHNRLTGPIPSELGDLPVLQILDLSNNNLSGPLHPNLGGLNLSVLTLDDDTGLCRTAALEEWLRRLGVTLPPCRATTENRLILTSEAPTSVPGQLLSVDEVNSFQLYIPGPGILIVETTGDTDTFGSLTQEGTRDVTTDEDSGADNNFRIAQPVSGDKWYSVAVSGGGETGEYTLVVEYRPGVFENPKLGSFQSGVGVISGWVCEADQVVIEFERPGGTVWREPASYGTSRPDTAGECGHPDSGFGLLWNWNKIGPGKHTVRAMVDGVVLAEHILIVTTLGLGEFPKGLRGDYQLADFPHMGDTTRLLWQEAQQNFVIAAETGGGGGGHQNPGQAILEIPQPGSFQSGIGVISGWVCEAEQIDIVFDPDTDNEMTFQAGYGTSRTDTSGKCGDSANGFGLLWNWNKLGPGQHTIRALADGFEFARSTFTVTTFGQERLLGVEGEYELEDFPEVGMTVTVKWQEALQNFTITGVE